MKRYLLILLMLPTFTTAQSWIGLGSPGFSAGIVSNTAMAIDPSGTPYVLFLDSVNGYRATVMKYDGSNWVTVGSPGFSGAGTIVCPSIAIDKRGTPYVAFDGNGATVMKFDGSNWVYVGSPLFSGDIVSNESIAIDGNGTPYVVCQDPIYGMKATVMKYDDSNWVTVGYRGFSYDYEVQGTAIAIDESGTPYVVFQDFSNSLSGSATVMKFYSCNWVYVGIPGFSADMARYPSIAIKGNIPYVAYQDLGNLGKATVMAYESTGWVALGGAGFTSGVAYYTSIAITPDGTPYLAYADVTNVTGMGPAMVMKYIDTSWVTVGNADFSAGVASYTSIAIDSTGTPYVAYLDYANGYRATVKKFGAGLGVKSTSPTNYINIFPNPATTQLNISAPDGITTVAITNLIGQTVYSNSYQNSEVRVDVSGLAEGVYLVRINGTEVRKFVKE